MSDSSTASIDTLLMEGLFHFSRSDVEQANDAWRAVLEQEADHETAMDYLTHDVIQIEIERDPIEAMRSASSVMNAYADADAGHETLKQIIIDLLKEGNLEEAFTLLNERSEDLPRIQKLIRNLFTLRYIADLGPLYQELTRKKGTPEHLSPVEQHVLAVLDAKGADHSPNDCVAADELLHHSWYDPFLVLRSLLVLRDRGLVGVRPGDSREEMLTGETLQRDDLDSAHPDPADAPVPTAPPPASASESDAESTASDRAPSFASVETAAARSQSGSTSSSTSSTGDSSSNGSNGDRFDHLFRRAVTAYVQGEMDTSRKHFEQCLELRPNDERVQRKLDQLDAYS